MNQTFQSRLRRANITTIDEANKFLKSYLKKFNDKFALHLNTTKSVFEKMNYTLSMLCQRKVDSGHSIKFKNIMDCIVIEAYNKNLYVNILDQIYVMKEIFMYEQYLADFDEKLMRKRKYLPPMSHPWKKTSCISYIAKQKHRNNGANV